MLDFKISRLLGPHREMRRERVKNCANVEWNRMSRRGGRFRRARAVLVTYGKYGAKGWNEFWTVLVAFGTERYVDWAIGWDPEAFGRSLPFRDRDWRIFFNYDVNNNTVTTASEGKKRGI
jgi:hypothetical protein